MTTKEPVQLERKWNDGAHCGLSDWYAELEKAIRLALARGPRFSWTTGWYGSKKEIASACITCTGGEIHVRTSCSDDFDTEGDGDRTIPFSRNLQKIREAILAAWEDAEKNRDMNASYLGYSIGRRTGQKHRGLKIECLEYTYLVDRNGSFPDGPPGDCYHEWGWQEETPDIPKRIKEKLENGMLTAKPAVYAGSWMAKLWE